MRSICLFRLGPVTRQQRCSGGDRCFGVARVGRTTIRRMRNDGERIPVALVTTARRDVVRVLDGWPTAADIVAAYTNIAALT